MQKDYVIQLISGRTDEKGDFKPFKENPNKPIDKIIDSSDDTIHDIMVKETIWLPLVKLSKEQFVKTFEEKQTLKEMKKEHKLLVNSAGFNAKKRLNVTDPQTIIV